MEITLKPGEWSILGRGWLKRKRVMFAGEVSPGTYSVVLEWTNAHNSAAYNLYFNKSQNEFQAFNGRVTIVDVSMKEMRFRFVK
jgi:hypothetical protein